ncbi:hypothetical protein EBT31_18215, partial [bacterium]|nr:hypothetical protein [bacterium]
MVEINQGGDGTDAIDALSSRSRTSSQGRLQSDTAEIDRLTGSFTRLEDRLRSIKRTAREAFSAINGIFGASREGGGGGTQPSGAVRNSVPAVGTTTRNAVSQGVRSFVSARGGGAAGGLTGG